MRWGVSGPMMSVLTALAGGAALVAAFVAGLTAWWVFTDPATAASVFESRDWRVLIAPLARGLVRALFAR